MKVQVYNQQAQVVGDIELVPALFELKPNPHLMAESVRVQLSNARTGLAHTKTRGEVRGGGKKPWKQKGTGRARAGSIRSPLWRHGGVTFGPRSDRNWSLKINRTAKTKALLMALSDKVSSGKFLVVDKIEFADLKTKLGAGFVKDFTKALNLGKKQLLLLPDARNNLMRVFRNIPSVQVVSAKNLNIVDLLKNADIIALKDSIKVLEETFKREIKVK